MAQAGARAYEMLRSILRQGQPAKAWRQVNFLVPRHAQYTSVGLAKGFYERIGEYERQAGQMSEIALWFTAADIHDRGPSVLAYAATQQDADRIADACFALSDQAELAF